MKLAINPTYVLEVKPKELRIITFALSDYYAKTRDEEGEEAPDTVTARDLWLTATDIRNGTLRETEDETDNGN